MHSSLALAVHLYLLTLLVYISSSELLSQYSTDRFPSVTTDRARPRYDDSLFDFLDDRDTRNVDYSSSGSGIYPSAHIHCNYSSSESAFKRVSLTLQSLAAQCTSSNNYNFTITSGTTVTFTTHTGDTSLLFADIFRVGSFHVLNVSVSCTSSCDVVPFRFSLYLTVLNYTERLLPNGEDLNDRELRNVDDGTTTVVVNGNRPLPIYGKQYRKLYLSSNGLLSLTRPFPNWQAVPFPYGRSLIPIIAPYWTDLNMQTTSSIATLYHNVYTSNDPGLRAQNILSIASDRINSFQKESFEGHWVLIATWSNVSPYIDNISNNSEVCTFQLVLVSDYISTYALYLYKEDSFTLQTYWHQTVIGHTAGDLITYYTASLNNSQLLKLDSVVGNTGSNGQWLFKISSLNKLEHNEYKCNQWINSQETLSDNWANGLPVCPCTIYQARNDWRFSFVSSSNEHCAIFVPTSTQHGLECCYNGTDGALVVGGGSTQDRSRYHYYHSLYYPSEHIENDVDPYRYCCIETQNCQLFYKYRPQSDCSKYEAPQSGFVWGDPHFETPDGTAYTFNGLGEYQYISSTQHSLNVQIRLTKLTSTSTATVLTAVAIRSHQSQLVQIELGNNGQYVLYVGFGEYRSFSATGSGEYLVVTDTAVHSNDSLYSVDGTAMSNVYILYYNDLLYISTSSGAAILIGKQENSFLYMSVQIGTGFSSSTQGLFGFYDDDPSNDFKLPNGTVLSTNLNESEIYDNFGLEWHISSTQSIFYYHSQSTYSTYNSDTYTFSPTIGINLLYSNTTLYDTAVAYCEEDYSCLYDTAVTGNVSFGLSTHKIRQLYRSIQANIGNNPPIITGPRQLIVSVANGGVAHYSAIDPDDGMETSLYLNDPNISGITLNSTGHITFSITTLPTAAVYISSNDSDGATSTLSLSVLLCHCLNNGTCIKSTDSSSYPLNSHGHYRLLCNCPAGFAGKYCENDVHGCVAGGDPCPTYTSCGVDGVGMYVCSECDEGYSVTSEGKCVDTNECTNSSLYNCSPTQVCSNTIGSYQCNCPTGYSLSTISNTCIDIDECSENIDNCEHFCTNTAGSYMCTCDDGWSNSTSPHLCVPDESCASPNNELGLCSSVNHAKSCALINNGIHCRCANGYYFTGSTCSVCSTNAYGFECSRTCDCQNNGVCDPATGCTCTTGWTGHDCTTESNAHTPSFSSDTPTNISLPLSLPSGTPFLTISASDLDPGSPGHVTYHVISSPHPLPPNVSDGVGIFAINSTTGILSTIAELSGQPFTRYLINIQAVDGGMPPNKASMFLLVELNNRSLPTPLISLPSQTVTVDENTAASVVLFRVNCTELLPINQQFSELGVSIVGGNINDTFSLNGNEVISNGPIDYEKIKLFNLTFKCVNSFNNSDTSNQVILIINLDDNPFTFSSTSYYVEIYENITSGSEIATVSATDSDISNGIVQYSMIDPYSVLSINQTTGIISVDSVIETPFDREVLDNYTYIVQALLYTTNGTYLNTTEANLYIHILDVNDFTPHFANSIYYSTNISQNSTYLETVLYVSAIDRDLLLNGDIYYTMESNDYFDVNSVTGEIYVTTDSIQKGTYLLTVWASDRGHPSLNSSTLISILVRATFEELRFSQNFYSFSFPEDVGPGMTVAMVTAVLYDIFGTSIQEGSAVEMIDYQILSGGSDSFAFTSNGEIIVTTLLDYEAESVYVLYIMAHLPEFSSVAVATTRIHITLEDVNDNHPLFQPLVYSKVIYENAQIGTPVLIVSATDRDQNGMQSITYSIQEGFDGPFTINSTTGLISTSQNLQTPKDYHFTVLATDAGLPIILTSEATVHISVSRASTVTPVLNSTLYIFSIPESFSSDTTIGTVGAITEGNRSVSSSMDGLGFRLKLPSYSVPYETVPFNIDPVSGAITVNTSYMFNRETQEEFVYYIELYNITDPQMVYDTTPAVIKITDVNDNPPIFTSTIYSTVIPLNTTSGSSILNVYATDIDQGSNSNIIYSLSSPVLGFHVDMVTGNLSVTNHTLLSGDYHVTVVASDKGHPAMNTSVNVSITILPSPSQYLTFSKSSYTFNITEGSGLLGRFIGSVTIDDINNQTFTVSDIIYSLHSTFDCFNIDSATGDITVSCSSLDREDQSMHQLVVVATAPNGLTSSVGVGVVVNDLNDNGPMFDPEVYTDVIYTNFNGSEAILVPRVTDIDSVHNAVSTFSIVSSNELVNELFAINSSTGEIFVNHSAVRNNTLPKGDYNFTLVATDGSLTDTAVVQISIVEPSPKILELTSLIFSVPENSPGGTLIGTLQLQTPQLINPADYIGQLDFQILSDHDYFYIVNSNASLLLLNNLLDREVTQTHVLLVQASFLNYHVSTSSYITVIVTDVNDNSPIFNQSIYSVSISSEAPLNSTVVTVHATDNDEGVNALLTYSIANSSLSYFTIDSSTGQISTTTDQIPVDHYSIVVTARDGGAQARTGTAIVSINVEVPLLDSISFEGPYVFSVTENSPSSTYVGVVSVVQPMVSGLTYSLVPNLNDFFLDPTSGNLTTLVSINREEYNKTSTTVRAYLQTMPPLVATTNVTIVIEDVNDNNPVFSKAVYNVGITEDTFTINSVLVTVQASDLDASSNGAVTYSISGTSFTVDSVTGDVRATSSDISSGSYHVTVTATDNGNPPLSSTAELVITVYTATVAFTQSIYTVSVSEASQLGSSCGNVSLVPINPNQLSTIGYTIDTTGFVIVGSVLSASIYNSMLFDYEEQTSYSITVTASVQLIGPPVSIKTATTVVTVSVTDENDNNPQFQNGYYTASVDENSQNGVSLLSFAVSDADSGSNGQVSLSLQNNYDNKFRIVEVGSNGGRVETGSAPIDRETDASFTLVAVVTDHGATPLSSTALIVVTVNDVNDNAPELVSTNGFNYYFNEEQKPGVALFSIPAIDVDVNSVLSFSILPNSDSDFFNIDSTNGTITSTIQLDSDNGRSEYELNVRVSDGTFSQTKTIHLYLLDVPNDHRPEFVNYPSKLFVSPRLAAGANLTHITAKDGDGDQLYYKLTNHNELLTIEPHTGLLQLKVDGSALPQGDTLTIDVTVTDDSVYSLQDSRSFSLIILRDLDFTEKVYNFTVPESTFGIGNMSITNPTLIENGNFNIEGSAQSYFQISKLSDHLSITSLVSLDYEIVHHRMFVFNVSAHHVNSTSSQTTVRVSLSDLNDNAPTFTDTNYRFVIPSDAAGIIGTVNVSDSDSGLNGEVTLTITSSTPFDIDPRLGVVRVTGVLEPGDEYSIVVRAVDHGSPTMSSTATYTVVVTASVTTGITGPGLTVGISIVTVILVAVTIVACILGMFVAKGRREKNKKKNRDPYLDNENWRLAAPPDETKGNEAFEMKRKDSESAYETMYEDDLLDFKRMPWSNPGYRDTEDESKLPETETEDGGSDLTASASMDFRQQSLESQLMRPKSGSQKEVVPLPVPTSRRGRRASAEDSSSDLDTTDYLTQYQGHAPMKPGEHPSEYDMFVKENPDKPPPGTRGSVKNLFQTSSTGKLTPSTSATALGTGKLSTKKQSPVTTNH